MISAGYYVALWKAEPWVEPGLSVSDCLSFLAPDWWGLGWTRHSPAADPVAEAARFGITADALPLVQEWAAELYDKGGFRVHHTFGTAASAVEFRRRFVRAPARVLGLSLPQAAASLLLSQYAGDYRDWLPGPYSWLKEGSDPDHGGEPRGFEILGYVSTGQFETARCNGLEKDFEDRLGIASNTFGLVDDPADAQRCADYANQLENTCAELWLPGLLTEYPEVDEGT